MTSDPPAAGMVLEPETSSRSRRLPGWSLARISDPSHENLDLANSLRSVEHHHRLPCHYPLPESCLPGGWGLL